MGFYGLLVVSERVVISTHVRMQASDHLHLMTAQEHRRREMEAVAGALAESNIELRGVVLCGVRFVRRT